MLEQLPYLHYWVKTHGAVDVDLVSPAEVASGRITGGSSLPPERRRLSLPAYRFDFRSIVAKENSCNLRREKRCFNGMAFSAVTSPGILVCTFEYPFGLRAI